MRDPGNEVAEVRRHKECPVSHLSLSYSAGIIGYRI